MPVIAGVPVNNLSIVSVALNTGNSNLVVSVADAGGNVYHKDADVVNASGARLTIFSSTLTTALAAGDLVTVTTPAGISDKAMQVTKTTPAVFDTFSSMTGFGIQPTSHSIIPTVTGASYLLLGADAAVSPLAEWTADNPTAWSSLGNAQSNANANSATNTIIYDVRTSTIGNGAIVPILLGSESLSYNAIGKLQNGAAGQWAAGIFAYREVAPTATITFPVSAGVYNAASWTTITGSSNEVGGSGVQKVELQIKQTSPTPAKYWSGTAWVSPSGTWVTATGTNAWTYALAASNMTSGYQYSITARATDNGGSLGTSTAVAFTYSAAAPTPPVVTSFFAQNPANGAPSTGVPPLLTSWATDTDNVTAAEYFIDTPGANGIGIPMTGGFPATTVQPMATVSAATFAGLTDGSSHIFYMHARDAAGNWSSLVSSTLKKDAIAPVVTSFGVTPDLASTAPQLNATISDLAGWGSNLWYYEYFVDVQGANGTGARTTLTSNPAMVSSGSPTYTVNNATLAGFAGLSEGSHTVYIHSQDVAGNWGAVASATFVKDTRLATTITWATPSDITYGTAVVGAHN